ncbi:MAG: type secretion system permease/ATPase [Sphingomonas bacterium]|nr:type secretion system permease/ATPase [Sphingomonas bacterium]
MNHVIEPKPRFAPWLLEPMLRNRSVYGKVALAAVLINCFNLLTSIFSMVVYDRVVPNNAIASLIGLTIGLAMVVIFDFILKLLRAYFIDYAGARIDREVGENVFARILAMRLELRTRSTGAMTGIMRELEAMRDFFASATMVALVDVPFVFLTLIVIALIGGWVVLVPLVVIPLIVLVGWLTHPAMERLSARTMGQGLLKNSVLTEMVGGIETMKAIGAGPLLEKRWSSALIAQSDSALRQRLIGTIATTFAGSASTISYSGVVILGVFLIASGKMTTGGLVACSILSSRAIAPLAQISQLLSRLEATRAAYRQLQPMMENAVEGPEGDGIKLAAISGKVEFRGVSFSYPGATQKTLKDISFTIQAGERVGVLGRVGSGKSTLARLILGLYPPEEGLVMLDGVDLRQLHPSFRRGIGVALQESVLLSGTIRENITLGRPEIDDTALLRASEISGTHQFIGQVANGYDLKLQDRGEGLSGGQRQSIAIARALAADPAMILLDEPTSAMDTQSEEILINRLGAATGDKTLIVITHRPQLLKLVNRIIVLENGAVALDGPRDAVIKQLSTPRAAA